MKDKDGKRVPKLELPLERIVMDNELAASVFHVPVAPEKQEIVSIPAKSRQRLSQVVSVESVKILVVAEAPLLATSRKRQAQDRYHTKVDTFKNLHKKLKPDTWVKHVQKMWADPANDRAWGLRSVARRLYLPIHGMLLAKLVRKHAERRRSSGR